MNKQYLAVPVLFLVTLLMAGCTSLDRAPQTIEEGLYVSASYGEALTLSVNNAYRNRVIEKEDQLQALDNLQISKDAVQSGLAAYNIGNYDAAQTGLDRAESILRTVALLLARYGEGT